MTTQAYLAAKARPTRLSRWLGGSRWRRPGVLAGAVAVGIALAVVFGWAVSAPSLEPTSSTYIVAAGLVAAALAVERATELVVAPWVGAGDHRIDRSIFIAGFAFVFGVVASGSTGLYLLDVVGVREDGTGWIADVSRVLDVALTGLLLAGGARSTHAVVKRLENRAITTKDEDRTGRQATQTSVGGDDPKSGSRLIVGVRARPGGNDVALEERVASALPGWACDPVGRHHVVHRWSSAPVGSSDHLGQAFGAAHRLHSAGLDAAPGTRPMESDSRPSAAHPRWALNRLGLSPGLIHNAGGGEGVTVAVIDTGIVEHPDGVSRGQIIALSGSDVIDGDDDPADQPIGGLALLDFELQRQFGHGTKVASVIAAPGEGAPYSPEWWSNSAMVGVAPQANIAPIRAVTGAVQFYDDDIAEAVRVASKNDCDVISMSLGGYLLADLEQAIDEAVERGAIVVCAAGNAVGTVVSPANYQSTIAVAGVDPNGQPFWDGSSRGPEVTVAAPGAEVWRATFDNDSPVVEPGSGTTYATAHVAGLAALWLSHWGRARLLAAGYAASEINDLFRFALLQTVTLWPDPILAADWGRGIPDASRLLAFQVVDGSGHRVFDPDQLLAARGPAPLSVVSSMTGLIANVFTGDAKTPRERLFDGVVSAFGSILTSLRGLGRFLRRLGSLVGIRRQTSSDIRVGAPTVTRKSGVPPLVEGELIAHGELDPTFRAELTHGEIRSIPVHASPELRAVLEAAHSDTSAAITADGPEANRYWGVGLSLPLRRVLDGSANVVRGYRWIGLAALVVAAVVALVFASRPTDSTGTVTSAVFLGLGLYGVAQAIERLLEFTVGRIAFHRVPGREADRALILLGCGILLGTIAATVTDLGLLHQIAPDSSGPWLVKMDGLITGLVIGGGSTAVHDLLTVIRLPDSRRAETSVS